MTLSDLAMKNDLVTLAGVYKEGGKKKNQIFGGLGMGKREGRTRQGRG